MSSRWPPWIWLLLVVPVALGLARLRFDVEVLNLLPGDSPVVQGIRIYQEHFAGARELVVTVRAPEAEAAESAARALAQALRARPDLVAQAHWQPPWLEHPGQSAELIAFLWLNQQESELAQLANRLGPAGLSNTLAEARERLATSLSPNDLAMSGYDPFGLTRLPGGGFAGFNPAGSDQEFFASADGTFRVLFVESARDLTRYYDCEQWLAAVQAVVEARRAESGFPQDVTVDYTGRPAFVAEIAGGMERDITAPSLGTLAVIALLFYLTYRCWRPLFWLVTLLVLTLVVTLALGGLIYGTLNVVSLGFASILLGLGEDFGIVLYQESRAHPAWTVAEVRRAAAPGILWSAITTAGAFILLNLSGMPGLGQLGTLVALGVGVAAAAMLAAYLPPLLRTRKTDANVADAGATVHEPRDFGGDSTRSGAYALVAWSFTLLLVLAGGFLLWKQAPRFDQSPDALRPRHSPAYAALNEIKTRLTRPNEPLWVVVRGRNEADVAGRLAAVAPVLERARSNGIIAGFTLPDALWPRPDRQAANRLVTLGLAERRASLRASAVAAGFTSNSLALAESVFDTWQRAARATGVFWPTNDNSRWVLEKLTARGTHELLAVGLVHLHPGGPARWFRELSTLQAELPPDGVRLSGWELLGPSVAALVRAELPRVVLPILVLVFVSLGLAFRNARDVLLSMATLACSALALHVVMFLAGWSWNMMNLMALPLLLGMGVDFSIHIQLALRRHQGDVVFVRRSVGRALLLAGSTTVTGFASLGFASNAGIAALGKVCAAGIVCAMLTAVFLLPVWWTRLCGTQDAPLSSRN